MSDVLNLYEVRQSLHTAHMVYILANPLLHYNRHYLPANI